MTNDRCRVCGYKFKKNDPDICPECLTSRQETAECDDLSPELHSHEKTEVPMFSQNNSGFDAQKELEEERKEDSELKQKYNAAQQKPNDGIPEIANSPLAKHLTDTQRKKLEALYSSSRQQQTTSEGYVPPVQADFGQGRGGFKKRRSTAVKVIVIVIVIYIIISLVSAIATSLLARNNSNHRSSYDSGISIEKPEIDFGDVSTMNMEFGDTVLLNMASATLHEPEVLTVEKDIAAEFSSDIYNKIGDETDEWYALRFNISLKNNSSEKTYFKDFDCNIECFSDTIDGLGLDSLSAYLEFYERPTLSPNESKDYTMFCIVPKCDKYRITLSSRSLAGSSTDYIYEFEPADSDFDSVGSADL